MAKIIQTVKIDQKGRITLPSVVRILSGLNEGSEVLLIYDEGRVIIELIPVEDEIMECSIVGDSSELLVLLSKFKIVSLSCVSASLGGVMHCDVKVSKAELKSLLESRSDSVYIKKCYEVG